MWPKYNIVHMEKRLYGWMLAGLLLASCTTTKDKGDDDCVLNVCLPQELFGGAKTAQFALSANGENGEEELGLYEMRAEGDSVMVGEWMVKVDKACAASLLWTDDPHVGFSFFLEPGQVTAHYAGNYHTLVTGTPLNDSYAAYTKESDELPYQQRDSLTEVYMKRYNETPLFGMLFTSHSAVMLGDSAEVERLWAMGGEQGRKMKYARSEYERICHNNVTNGEPLRDVEIAHATVDGEGESVKLSDYIGKGKWVFVDFWASWCGGCRQAIPLVKEVYEELKNENILFVSIAEWDRRTAALKAMQEERMPWLQLIDEKGACGDAYMFNSIPRFMLFAPDGTLVEKDIERENIRKILTQKVKGTE